VFLSCGQLQANCSVKDLFTMAMTFNDCFVVLVNSLQVLIDAICGALFGYTTKYGRKKERLLFANSYDMSAQVVSNWSIDMQLVILVASLEKDKQVQQEEFDGWLHFDTWKVLQSSYPPERWQLHCNGMWQGTCIFCVHSSWGWNAKRLTIVTLHFKVDVYNLIKHPFTCITQIMECSKIIIMKHWAFNRLARELGDPQTSEVCINYLPPIPVTFRRCSANCDAPPRPKWIDTALPDVLQTARDVGAIRSCDVKLHQHWVPQGKHFEKRRRLNCAKLCQNTGKASLSGTTLGRQVLISSNML